MVVSLAVILTVYAHYVLKYLFAYVIFGKERYNALADWQRVMLIQCWGLFLCFVVVGFLSSFSVPRMRNMLGLRNDVVRPLLFALAACVPSFAGYAWLNGYNHETNTGLIAWYSLWPGFNEELVYRAFIVGILVRYANWNFIFAALMSALLFASGHLYQAGSMREGVEIFLFTSGVGIGFSLFYKYWDWNIWFTIFLHVLMNLAYVLFVWHGNAVMNGPENIFRFITIGIAIVFSVQRVISKRRKQRKGSI